MTDEIGRRLVAGHWVLPYFAERSLGRGSGEAVISLGDVTFPENEDPCWSVIGALGSPGRAAVDSRGMLTPTPGGWSIDWCVGAEDRWHVPSRESAVTQRLSGGVPIVETALKVPGGQAVHRAFATAGNPPTAVVEVENASAVPFAVAFVIRPFDQVGVTRVSRVDVDATVVSVDGAPALVLPRPPLRTAVSTLDRGDCLSAVTSGDAAEEQTAGITDPAGVATGAVLLPVPHRATVRAEIPLSRSGSSAHGRSDLATRSPTAAEARRGWGRQLATGLRAVLPDERTQRAVDAARAHLVLLDDGVEITPVPWGNGERTADDVVAVLTALRRWGFDGHADEVGASVPKRWVRKHRPPNRSGPLAWGEAEALLADASPTFAWPAHGAGHHGRPLVDFLLSVRDGLISEEQDGVAMLPALPRSWRGRPLEVRDAPTSFGPVSYAVRWHGERPALLWEGAKRIRFRAPGLDAEWSSEDPSGEVLLGRG